MVLACDWLKCRRYFCFTIRSANPVYFALRPSSQINTSKTKVYPYLYDTSRRYCQQINYVIPGVFWMEVSLFVRWHPQGVAFHRQWCT